MKRTQFELYTMNVVTSKFEYITTLRNRYKLNDLISVLDEEYQVIEVKQ